MSKHISYFIIPLFDFTQISLSLQLLSHFYTTKHKQKNENQVLHALRRCSNGNDIMRKQR